MTDPITLRRRGVLAAAGLLLAGRPAMAASWPQRPLRVVVGFPAGTSPDLMARLLAEPLASALGQSVIVENKPGAGGNIGADIVAKATDGHTFGLIGSGALAASPALYPKLPFSLKDFKPITTVGSSPLMLVTASSVSFADPGDFLRVARAAGDRWSYGSVGMGSSGHIATELLKEKTGMAPVHVPFNGVPAIFNAMMGGQIHMAVVPLGNASAQIQAGRIKGVALTSAARSSLAPGMPTLAEAGVSGFDIEVWNALMAPAATPASSVAIVADAVARIIRTEEMRQKLFAQGWRADGTAPAALERRIKDDTATYAAIIRARGIRLE
jgi:tripartite-type tricarboxylate transporter receptor subunit TctC